MDDADTDDERLLEDVVQRMALRQQHAANEQMRTLQDDIDALRVHLNTLRLLEDAAPEGRGDLPDRHDEDSDLTSEWNDEDCAWAQHRGALLADAYPSDLGASVTPTHTMLNRTTNTEGNCEAQCEPSDGCASDGPDFAVTEDMHQEDHADMTKHVEARRAVPMRWTPPPVVSPPRERPPTTAWTYNNERPAVDVSAREWWAAVATRLEAAFAVKDPTWTAPRDSPLTALAKAPTVVSPKPPIPHNAFVEARLQLWRQGCWH